jgi:CspA family cold shock protein
MTVNPPNRPLLSSTSVPAISPATRSGAEGESAAPALRPSVSQHQAPSGPAVVTATKITNLEGSVKWFDPKKGFGFIVGPEGQDIFAHFSRIAGEGFRVLKDGSRVVYDAERGEKGWSATRVVRIDDDDPGARRHYARTPRR